jgi:hypothetical protein
VPKSFFSRPQVARSIWQIDFVSGHSATLHRMSAAPTRAISMYPTTSRHSLWLVSSRLGKIRGTYYLDWAKDRDHDG